MILSLLLSPPKNRSDPHPLFLLALLLCNASSETSNSISSSLLESILLLPVSITSFYRAMSSMHVGTSSKYG